MSGIHPGAKLVEKDKGLVSLASKNPWADLAGMEDEEDDMDQEEQKRAQEAAAAAAPAAKAGAAAPAAAAGPDLEGPAADGLLRPPTTAKVCNTDKEVKEEVEKICAVSTQHACTLTSTCYQRRARECMALFIDDPPLQPLSLGGCVFMLVRQ